MVEITKEEAKTLDIYIRITTQHRKGEIEACKKLADEIDEEGQPIFPNMVANAKWWEEKEIALQEILKTLEKGYA